MTTLTVGLRPAAAYWLLQLANVPSINRRFVPEATS
jgi:hypothetical protein